MEIGSPIHSGDDQAAYREAFLLEQIGRKREAQRKFAEYLPTMLMVEENQRTTGGQEEYKPEDTTPPTLPVHLSIREQAAAIEAKLR